MPLPFVFWLKWWWFWWLSSFSLSFRGFSSVILLLDVCYVKKGEPICTIKIIRISSNHYKKQRNHKKS
jgi:hypothetical protein